MKIIDRSLLAAVMACAFASIDAAAATTTSPDEARLLAALQKAHPGTQFTGVSRTPIPEVYEVWMGSNMALVSRKNLRYLVFGRMFDTKTMTDLTGPKLTEAQRLQAEAEDREQATLTIPVAQLPLADAIKTVRGDGSRTLVVFSDPACPYCKRLEPELDKIDNVTIHTFLVPFQGEALPAAIWCAADRQMAWHGYMVRGDESVLAPSTPGSPASCAHPLERNLALAQRLKVHGTPTIIYADGRRTAGYASAADLEARLALVNAPVPAADARQEEVQP